MEAIDPQIRTLMQIQTLKVRSEHDQRMESLIQEGLRLRDEEQKSRRSLEETMQKTISYLAQLIQGAQGASSNNLPTWENQLHSSSSRRSPDNNLQLFDKLPERKLGSPANALQLFDEMPERKGNYEDVLDQPLLRRQPSTVVVNQKLTQGASSSNSSRSILSSPVNGLQVFDEMPERMIELPDFSLQGKTEGMVEQLTELKQTHDVQGLKLPIEEKVELANSYLQDNPEIMVEQPFELKQTKSEVTCKDQFGCLQLLKEKPSGISCGENIVKECEEEAGIPLSISQQAIPVGAVSYIDIEGFRYKRDVLFCYDLRLPDSFIPESRDGEVESFKLIPVKNVANVIKKTHFFKPNCSLVIIDFLFRHGYITPNSLGYLDLLQSLKNGECS